MNANFHIAAGMMDGWMDRASVQRVSTAMPLGGGRNFQDCGAVSEREDTRPEEPGAGSRAVRVFRVLCTQDGVHRVFRRAAFWLHAQRRRRNTGGRRSHEEGFFYRLHARYLAASTRRT